MSSKNLGIFISIHYFASDVFTGFSEPERMQRVERKRLAKRTDRRAKIRVPSNRHQLPDCDGRNERSAVRQ
jgi:hypothetical protein